MHATHSNLKGCIRLCQFSLSSGLIHERRRSARRLGGVCEDVEIPIPRRIVSRPKSRHSAMLASSGMAATSAPWGGSVLDCSRNKVAPSKSATVRCSFNPAGAAISSSSSGKSLLHSTFVAERLAPIEKSGVRRRIRPVVRAEAASVGVSSPLGDGIPAKKKFFGVDTVTLKKVIPLGLMFFCILFNYTILRDTKDVLVVTAKGSSAEIIPFLKTWVNLPMAIGFMVIYTKLSNVLSREALFYACILPFIGFFGSFAFLLYPLRDILHPTALADHLLSVLGPRFLGPIAIFRNWTFVLFYVMAELWGSVVVSVLFWGFANQITTVDEAKQFYPLFGLGANVALVFSGRTVKYFSELRGRLGPGVDGWGMSLKGMMSIVVILGFAICGIYWWVNAFVVNDPNLPKIEKKKKKSKPKMSMGESAKFLLNSRYIRDLATLVVAYGISINLVEVTWKSKLKAQFPSPNDYSSFMGDFSTWTGVVTFSMMLLSRVIFRKYGWGVAAAITPSVLLVTGVAFFSLVLFSDPLTPFLGGIGLTPLMAAVYVGALQNIFSKSAKYSLFDPCKEMAYIPLDEDTKVKGKAAIDVVCNPLGKSGGALIQQVLILSFGSLSSSTPYLGAILLVIVLAWLGAARSLDKQFTPMVQEDLKGKLLQGKLSAMTAALSETSKVGTREVTYRFVSGLNDKGFIEGRYVPVTPPTSETKPAPSAKDEPVEATIENGSPSPESGGSDVDTTTREPASIN
ncbi:ADP,ATP carrier protein 2, chloroplastic [Selaginella moellendorffii]|uniref:ADP,ATP carrier protein 2, chloroplastic n=1 Tax=Selaginella moellendorffii TaxID=88036 RepID=UPI000D1C3503|nr:ADP,ATP carrier protein 2, chloroplastic [Selaginella moellendorffii]|eukprot:XP_002974477.2 ADP,ATP carrier protein 2, chloroplastic [Selaginella moellendorffii]